jgi:hypothetical protein
MGFYIPEDAILHSHRCEDLKSYTPLPVLCRLDSYKLVQNITEFTTQKAVLFIM